MILHAAYAKDQTSIVGATENIANAAVNVGASTVLVSSDAVFSGDGTPRGEDAVPDPIWDYGRWKASAEKTVSTHTQDGTILRLPLIVSVDPDDHVVQRIRSAAARGETTNWFSDETRQPASAAELAAAIWQIVSLDPARRMGVWHLPGRERLSRAEIARRIVTRLGLDDDAVREEPHPCASRTSPASSPARRPRPGGNRMVASSSPRLTYSIRCHVVPGGSSLTAGSSSTSVARSGMWIWDTSPGRHLKQAHSSASSARVSPAFGTAGAQ